MNAFFFHGVLFVRAASRIFSVLITKTTVTFSFFSRSVAVQSILSCSSVNITKITPAMKLNYTQVMPDKIGRAHV